MVFEILKYHLNVTVVTLLFVGVLYAILQLTTIIDPFVSVMPIFDEALIPKFDILCTINI